MKSTVTKTLLATLALPLALFAQGGQAPLQGHHHYKLIDLGTFGGPNGHNESDPPQTIISPRGVAVASGDTPALDPYCTDSPDCNVTRAFSWHKGNRTPLPLLAVGASSFAYSINATGSIVGESENGEIDPMTGYPEYAAVLWSHGTITALGTLGGNQTVANAINDRGQVAGSALNGVPDPFANDFALNYLFVPAATQAHAVLWTEGGDVRDLGTLGGPDSTAVFLNEHGQIAGYSYTNTTVNANTGTPTQDPFFWENGHMVDIGTLGGATGTALGMNNRGQVVGKSDLAGDQTFHAFRWDERGGLKDLGTLRGFSYSSEANWINDAGEIVGDSDAMDASGTFSSHAFLWRKGSMIDLGTVANDACGAALSINSHSQVVGFGSADCYSEDHAFLWENGGPLVDLSTLVSNATPVNLIEAIFINDRGEIAARGKLANGDEHALALFPCDENHAGLEGCDYSLAD